MQQELVGAPPSDDGSTGPSREFLVVTAAENRCALPVDSIIEIHRAVALTPLPGAPDVVIGAVNRRGTVLPVLGLRRRLGLPTRPLRPDDCLVVLALPHREVAVLVDAALDTVSIPALDIHRDVASAAHAAYTSGVAVLPDGLLAVVDLEAFLCAAEAAALEQALSRSTS